MTTGRKDMHRALLSFAASSPLLRPSILPSLLLSSPSPMRRLAPTWYCHYCCSVSSFTYLVYYK